MQSKRASLKRLLSSNYKVSCHYLIDRIGGIYQMVPDNKVAWHAGKSKWKNINNLNEKSIGIELQNKGHNIKYEKFSKIQIKNLIKLCIFLRKKFKIVPSNILGHSDIAPLRKKDPGENFPWSELSKKGIGIWIKPNKLNYKIHKKNIIRNIFFRNLHLIGYRYFSKNRRSNKDALIIKAFQRRFNQNKVDGKIDKKTFEISHFLSKKSI